MCSVIFNELSDGPPWWTLKSFFILLHSISTFDKRLCLQNGSRWEHGAPDSTWSQAEDTAGASGCGSLVNPLPPDIQGNSQICSLQLHGAVWRFAPCQMDHLFYGGKVKRLLKNEHVLGLINEVDLADLLGSCGLCGINVSTHISNSWGDHVCYLIWWLLCSFFFFVLLLWTIWTGCCSYKEQLYSETHFKQASLHWMCLLTVVKCAI